VGLCPFDDVIIMDFWKNYKDLFELFFSQATAANQGVNLILVRADMDRSRLGVHNGGVAGSHACEIYGVPFAACGGWIKNVSAVTHD
jgi:hypothetical protein